MSGRAPLACILLCLGVGCYAPDLGRAGIAPFRCSDGACPGGYHCTDAICIRDGEPDPPRLLATTSIDAPPPEPVWDGARFRVFWHEGPGSDGPPGLRYRALDDPGDAETLLFPAGQDVAFDVLYHPGAGRHVVALRRNSSFGDELVVRSLVPGREPPVQHFEHLGAPGALGFSVPSLAADAEHGVTLVYTFAAPPAIVSDNVYCVRLDLAGGPRDQSCRPGPEQTQGSFATEAVVARSSSTTYIFWRAALALQLERSPLVHVTTIGPTGVQAPRLGVFTMSHLPVLHVARAVAVGGEVGVVNAITQREQLIWGVSLGPYRRAVDVRSTSVPTSGIVPDVAVSGRNFVTCARDAAGELLLSTYSAADLVQVGESVRVPRLSRAEIASCRLAVAPGRGEAAVAWQERLQPSAGRVYAAVVSVAQ